MTSEPITFNPFRCDSSSTALGTRADYWKPTRRATDETPLSKYVHWGQKCLGWVIFTDYKIQVHNRRQSADQ